MPRIITETLPNAIKARVYVHSVHGAFQAVTLSRRYVRAFAETYPGARLPNRGILFVFDRRNFVLTDHNAPKYADGAALVALSHVAQSYVEGIVE